MPLSAACQRHGVAGSRTERLAMLVTPPSSCIINNLFQNQQSPRAVGSQSTTWSSICVIALLARPGCSALP